MRVAPRRPRAFLHGATVQLPVVSHPVVSVAVVTSIMTDSIASMKRLTVIAVVGVIVGAVSSTTRVVTAMRTPGVAIAVIAFMNPDIIIAEKTVMVTAVIVPMAVIVIRGSVRVIHTRTQENG